MKEMISRARKDLIESGKYSYSNFIRKFDDVLTSQIQKREMEIPILGKSSVLIEPEKLNNNSDTLYTLKTTLRSFFLRNIQTVT